MATKLEQAAEAVIKVIRQHEVNGADNDIYIYNIHRLQRKLGQTPKCQICGCTDLKACPDGCYWIASSVCSSCEP